MDIVKDPGKEAEPEATPTNEKDELRGYNTSLVFKDGEVIDMKLVSENRTLIHSGELLQKTGFGWNRWTELFVLLFDDCLVMTEPKEEDGVKKYQVYQRPIHLDLLTLSTFVDPPVKRSRRLSSFESDPRMVYPCTIHHQNRVNGRFGGLCTLFAESEQERSEWSAKLEEAIRLRKIVRESNKVFEVETLNTSFAAVNTGPSCSGGGRGNLTGKVTCSVPFDAPDGSGLIVIGCAEGVWVGLRDDSRFVQVLDLRMVTQCAILEDFGLFIVLADKALYAYRIEALVPSSPEAASASQTPRRLSRSNDVEFFTSGNVCGRTLVIYMKDKSYNSVFKVLEPVIEKVDEKEIDQPPVESTFCLWSRQQEWFRDYRQFFLPYESYDLLFLRARIAILSSKGFDILELSDLKSVLIPVKDDSRMKKFAKRIKSCRPLGMFKLSKDEFLLCYDVFGLYVNSHGDPSRTDTVEWEGTVERAIRYHPYILLFNSRFIEVRHANTGHLVQIIPGNNLRCTNQSQPISEGSKDERVSQQLRVYGVMNVEEPKRGVTTQRVFELVPKVPLHLPGSSPHASHSNQSNSPPHSPRLTPEHPYSFR